MCVYHMSVRQTDEVSLFIKLVFSYESDLLHHRYCILVDFVTFCSSRNILFFTTSLTFNELILM